MREQRSRPNLLDAALEYHAVGWPVVSVDAEKRPLCKWGRWQFEKQTETEVKEMFSRSAHGIALLTWPASDLVVLDFDGPHADEIWKSTNITLPTTAQNRTQSGWQHHIFKILADTQRPERQTTKQELKRSIRLVGEQKACGSNGTKSCGVDLLLNGYFIVPPTPGYREDPDLPLQPGALAMIPAEVIHLAQNRDRNAPASMTVDSNWVTELMRGVPEGQRNDAAARLAGYFCAKGHPENITFTSLRPFAESCSPPLPLPDLQRVIASIYQTHGRRGRARQAHPPELPTGFEHLTDMGNARRFAVQHGQNVRYCHPWKKWLIWSGQHWHQDDTGEILRRAKDTVRTMYGEAQEVEDKNLRQAFGNHAIRCESESKLKAMLAVAESEEGIPVVPANLDRDPWRLNVENGTLDLRTGGLRSHRREDLITKLIPVLYDPKSQCPTWFSFLDCIFAGNERLIRFVQKAIGYALTGDTREQVLFLLHGPGSNGKTTLLETLLGLLGDYGRKTRSETLLAKRADAIPNDIARLRGARFVATVEAEEGRRFAESLLKELTGEDTISARFMRAEYFEFRPEFKLFMAFNRKPAIRGTDHAIWRRIRLIPFNVTIPDEEQDKELRAKLKVEWPGILRWAIEGCLTWQQEELKPPPEVLAATEQYRTEMDVLAGFLAECCETRQGIQTGKKELYQRYVEWSKTNVEPHIVDKRTFGIRLKEKGIQDDRTANSRFWKDLALVDV